MKCILKFRSPNLYTVIMVIKIKKSLLNKKEKVKSFFIFMSSFKQVESNYGKKEPCKRGCSRIIKFSHCLNFGYCKYGTIIFFSSNSKWLYTLHALRKTICEVNNFDTFLIRVNFILMFFQEELASFISARKPFPGNLLANKSKLL